MNYSLDIIVPAYNAADKISTLLQSFEKQKRTDFRVIIVDDGSTDHTYDFCRGASQKSAYSILVLTQQNQGPGIARQTGFKQADADYVMFCDADDYLHETAIDHLITILKKEPLDILEFGYRKITEQGAMIPSVYLKDEKFFGNCLEHYIKQKNTTNYLCNKVFKRQLLKVSDFKKLYYSEDARALALIFSRCTSYRVVSDPYYFYVINKDSACGKAYDLRRLDTVQVDEEICGLVAGKNPQLLPFAACTACVHTAKIYSGLKNAGLLDGELDRTLKTVFDRRYRELSCEKGQVYKTRSRRQILAVELFRISPSLFSILSR